MAQSAKEYLQAERKWKLAEATAIIDGAQKESRPLTGEEKARLEQIQTEVKGIDGKTAEMDETDKINESIERMRGPVNAGAEEAPIGVKTVGDAFVKSEAYQNLTAGFKTGSLTGQWTSGAVELKDFDFKATVTSTASPILQPDVQAGIQDLRLRRLTVADLLASGTTDSSVVRYLQETSNVNAAAATDEGALKPESTIVFGQVDEPVRKIATFLPVSDEMLEDAAQLRSYLDGRLRLFVQHAEEQQLLSGTGTAPQLRGILNRTGVQTLSAAATGTALVDFIYDAITNIRVNAVIEPDGVVMHPTNWAKVRKSKDTNGQYYGGGPFMGPYGQGGLAADNVWGLPVVVTSAMPLGTALVGAFASQGQVFRRGGLTVEASNSHADFFQKNLTAIRAEERLALAVYRPAAFHTITAIPA